jgi:hypothetical protein
MLNALLVLLAGFLLRATLALLIILIHVHARRENPRTRATALLDCLFRRRPARY